MNRARSPFAVAAGLVFAILAATNSASAAIIGSEAIARDHLDTAAGSVYIYAGGSLPTGATLDTFTFFDSATSPGYITPILFEQTAAGVFAVRGLGTGHTVVGSTSPQSFPFGLVTGSDMAGNGAYTFGFINSLLDSGGNFTAQSTGEVDMTYEAVQSGDGLGGAGTTNRWIYTPSTPGINMPIGTTFGVQGTVADYVLNDPSSDPVNHSSLDRTYSANLSATVPEPASSVLMAFGAISLSWRTIRSGRHRRNSQTNAIAKHTS